MLKNDPYPKCSVREIIDSAYYPIGKDTHTQTVPTRLKNRTDQEYLHDPEEYFRYLLHAGYASWQT